MRLIRRRNARRYILRVSEDGEVHVTVPRGGSTRGALALVDRQRAWIDARLRERAERLDWGVGTRVLLRGVEETIAVTTIPSGFEVRLGPECFTVASTPDPLRPIIETHLRRIAAVELPERTRRLAETHGLVVRRVTVRDQRTRWGSCSATGTVSLNWRLVQMPDAVRDYVILHELAHLRVLNHSPKFWSLVATLCPDHAVAERWLKEHGRRLR